MDEEPSISQVIFQADEQKVIQQLGETMDQTQLKQTMVEELGDSVEESEDLEALSDEDAGDYSNCTSSE